MTIYSIKPLFQKSLSPVASTLIKLKIHPTVINIAALVVSTIAGIMLARINVVSFFLLIIPVLLFTRIAFNALDGMVARGLSVSSANGEIYNEFIDRISDCSIFIGLVFNFIKETSLDSYFTLLIGHQLILGFLFIILFLLNSYVGILSKAAGKSRIYAGLIGKADRMFYLGLTCLIYYFYKNPIIWSVFYILMIIGTFLSLGERLWKSVKS